MAVRLVVAVTDGSWFEHLRYRPDLREVNFWAPSAVSFRALAPGELFLFKLHSPLNVIVGGGVFAYANSLPCSLAWEAFGEGNGARSLAEMRRRVMRYRKMAADDRSDFVVGCRVLTQTFFLPATRHIPAPASFSRQIVSFKTYSTDEEDGHLLWEAVQRGLSELPGSEQLGFADQPQTYYGEPVLIRPRLGQGAFRVLVTDTYDRKCVVTGEKTLPALDAAHIRPFAAGGVHDASNGLLFRRDIHSLFDAGYVTVTPALRFEVSRRIREEFENGRHYYSLHGKSVAEPKISERRPTSATLIWHNEHVFRG